MFIFIPDPPTIYTDYRGAQLGWWTMADDEPQQGILAQPIIVLGQIIGELAAIQHDQAEANQCWLALEQLAERLVAALPAPGPVMLAALTLNCMTAEDNVYSFLEAFEALAEVCGWPAGGVAGPAST